MNGFHHTPGMLINTLFLENKPSRDSLVYIECRNGAICPVFTGFMFVHWLEKVHKPFILLRRKVLFLSKQSDFMILALWMLKLVKNPIDHNTLSP